MNVNDPKNGKTIFDLLNQIDEEDKWLEKISDLLDDPQIDDAIRAFEEKTKSEEDLMHNPQVAKAIEVLYEKDAKRKMQQHRWHCKNRYGISVDKGKRFSHYMNEENVVKFCDDDILNKVILEDIADKIIARSFESDIVLELQYLFKNISNELPLYEKTSDLYRRLNNTKRELYKILFAYTSLHEQECIELCYKWLGLNNSWKDLYETYHLEREREERERIEQANDNYDAKRGYLDCLGLTWDDLPPGTNPYSIDLD